MKTAFAILLICSVSKAAVKYDQFYTDANGKRLETSVALVDAIKGADIYRCQTVETKLSKSGTSIGIHTVKKPKIAKD